MTARKSLFGRHGLATAALCLLTPSVLAAQIPLMVQPVRCARPVPLPFLSIKPAVVSVRMMAEGLFPEADNAAARALIVLVQDVLSERAPVAVLSTVEVLTRISSSMAAATDTKGMSPGTELLTAVVQRSGDSIVVTWTLRAAGRAARPAPPSTRITARADDIMRIALALARVAAREGAKFGESLGASPPPLGSIEAGDAYIYGLAEALASTPVSLARARESMIRASALAPSLSDVWRWRARVERSLLEWSRESDANERQDLKASFLAAATRAAQLAPRSPDSQLVLADAHLVHGDLPRAETLVISVAREDGETPGVMQRRSVLSRIRGDDARAEELLSNALLLAPRDGRLLVDLAVVALSRGNRDVVCYALNAAIASDDALAPAYALRAMIRGALGDRRASWIDAEIATRLGHPEWGERAAAYLDSRYGDANHAGTRLRSVGGPSAKPMNYLDAILLARANVAMSRIGTAAISVAPWTCKEYWWPVLVRDARAINVTLGKACTE